MIVVIEGERGVGKTTMVRTVVTMLRIARFFDKRVPRVAAEKWQRGKNPHKDMIEQIKQMSNDSDVHIVDRFHVTEFVMRLEDLLEVAAVSGNIHAKDEERENLHAELHHIHNELCAVHAPTIVLTCGWKTVRSRVNRRKDKTRKNLSHFAHFAFHETAKHLMCPTFRNDTLMDWFTTACAICAAIIHKSRS